MVENKTYSVLIVGAGPTGLLMGLLLRKHNISCLIIDKMSCAATSTRAVMVHSASLEIFHSLGIFDSILKKSNVTNYISFYYENYRKAILDFSKIDSIYPYYLLLRQPDLEHILMDCFLSIGGEIARNTQLLDIEQHENYVLSKAQQSNQIIQYQTDYLVGCDGASSSVRKLTNIPMFGNTFDFNYILAEGFTIEDFPKNESSMHLTDNCVLSVLPLPDGTTRIGGPGNFDDLSSIHGNEALITHFELMLKKMNLIKNMRFNKYTHVAKYTVHAKIAGNFRKKRIFLAGDSAHLRTPAGGQGMNTCFQDAWNLAWKLSFVINGYKKDEILDTYEQERKPLAEEVIKTANFFTFLTQIKKASTLPEMLAVDEISNILVRKISQNYMSYQPSSLDGRKYAGQLLTRVPSTQKEGWCVDYSKYNFFCNKEHRFLLPHNMIGKTNFNNIDTIPAWFQHTQAVLMRPDGYIIENFSLPKQVE